MWSVTEFNIHRRLKTNSIKKKKFYKVYPLVKGRIHSVERICVCMCVYVCVFYSAWLQRVNYSFLFSFKRKKVMVIITKMD